MINNFLFLFFFFFVWSEITGSVGKIQNSCSICLSILRLELHPGTAEGYKKQKGHASYEQD